MFKKYVLTFDENTPVETLNQYAEQLGFEFPINNGKLDVRVEKELGND